MAWGSLVVCCCLLLLGWTSEFVAWLFPIEDVALRKQITIVTAVFSIYAIDFSINVVQASCRSLIVDTLPIPQQQLGSAWATRMAAIGHLVGYAIGSFDMVKIFGTALGETQFKQLCIISGLSLLGCIGVTCWAVTERVLVHPSEADRRASAVQILSQLFKRTVNLPPRIRSICWVQFWSWIGWFPFLFYGTTWVGETYFRYEAPPAVAKSADDKLGEIGRLGSMALVIYSTITFISSVILPFYIISPDSSKKGTTPSIHVIRLLGSKVTINSPDLQTAWQVAHVMFASFWFFSPWVRSLRTATFLIAISGIPWSICSWAPFAFMGVEINRLASSPPRPHSRSSSGVKISLERSALREKVKDDADIDSGDGSDGSPSGGLAGIYLGVLNVYTTLPQFVGTFISWVVFTIFEPQTRDPEHQDGELGNVEQKGPNPISICLFIGAMSACLAFEATRRLKKVRSG
ncbi:hypothetical protein KEM56_004192 [Ascosphaera pollenicola]|nr:hypothetical protein KEM56_004192 [Ascosphaera pollenicola]